MKSNDLPSASDSSKPPTEYEWERCWKNRRKLQRHRFQSNSECEYECECRSDEDDIFELEDLDRRLRRLQKQFKEYEKACRRSMDDCLDDEENDYQYVSSEIKMYQENEHGSSLCEMRSLQQRIHALRQRIKQQRRKRASNPREQLLHEARLMLHCMRAGLAADDQQWQKMLDNLDDDIEADEQYIISEWGGRTSNTNINEHSTRRIQTIWLGTNEEARAHQSEKTTVFDDVVACENYVSSAQHPVELIVSSEHTNDKRILNRLYTIPSIISIRQLDHSKGADQAQSRKLLSVADQRRTIVIFLTSYGEDADVVTLMKQLSSAADSILIFDNAVDCLDYITKMTGCVIAIIVIDDYANDWKILTMLNDCPPVSVIYRRIHDRDQRPLIDERELAETCPKLRGSFNETNPLCRRIAANLSTTVSETFSVFGPNNTERSIRNLDQEEVIFLWYQIMIDLVRSFPVTDQAWPDFITECRKQCIGNNGRLAQIDEFQRSYLSVEALQWYTRQRCFFQIVNEALRKQNATTIYNLRLFISDLSRELLRRRQSTAHVMTLYRGQLMHNDEINRIRAKQAGLIAFNSFLSTSSSKQVAEIYGGVDVVPDSDAHSFLMLEIEATTDTCCSLVNDTVFMDEDEYLFMPAAIFKIVSFEFLSPRSYYVKLCYTTDRELTRLSLIKKHFERKVGLHSGPISLAWGRYLYHMGEYNAAKEYYFSLLEQSDPDQLSFVVTIENDLAQVYLRQNLYHEAYELQKRALQRAYLASTTLSNMSIFYENYGHILFQLSKYPDALDNYLRALDIENRQQPVKKENLARIYSSIGLTYNNMHQFMLSLGYFRHAFRIQRYVSLDHSADLAATCNNIGIVYTNIGEHKLAHKYYSEALSISLRSLPHDHPSVQIYLKNRDIYLVATSIHDNKKPFFIEMLRSHRRASDASVDDIEIVCT